MHKYKEYRSYGDLDSSSEASGLEQNFRYTGKPLDNDWPYELNLYYYGARYYDPEIPMFYGVDPMYGKYPGLSPYAYCSNNPIKLVDPDGNLHDIFIDIPSAALGAYDLYQKPSWGNAGWFALDLVGLLPLIPSVAAVRHGGKIDNIIKAMKRGLQSEKKVLKTEKLTKNTRKIPAIDPKTGKPGATIPDAVQPNGQTIEIKDRKYISDSPQLRRQSVISEKSGKKAKVINARKDARVSSTVRDRMDVQPPKEVNK